MAKTEPKISARRVVLTSFLVDVTDVVLNIWVAVASGSVVMISQSIQGLADLLTSGLLLWGVRRSRRKADAEYNFGYGRELFFWILMSGVSMLILTAGLSIYIGIDRLIRPLPIDNVFSAYVVLGIGLVTNSYALSLSLRRLHARHFSSGFWESLRHPGLIETKATLILDTLGAVASLLGLLALLAYGITGQGLYDALGAILVGLLSGVLAIFLIIEAKDLLVGRGAKAPLADRIMDVALSVPGVEAILDFKTMYLGSEELLVNMEVHVADEMVTDEIEELMDRIKQKVKRAVPVVRHIQVEVETPRR
jgi:cation diffusion facilitator family transporter